MEGWEVSELAVVDSFRGRVLEWLASYKRNELGVAKNGVWKKNGKEYAHILPAEQRGLNVLGQVREGFWSWFETQQIRLHSDFHHLNSSQAVCFNLFYPWLGDEGKAATSLLRVLGEDEDAEATGRLEQIPDRHEGTNFDFVLEHRSGRRVFVELKYTEREFGSAAMDNRHRWRFENVYKPRLRGRFAERFFDAEEFLKNYQIARNVWHLDEGDALIFLLPRANVELRKAEKVIRSCASEQYASQVSVVYMEDTARELGPEMRDFTYKYFPMQQQ